MGEKSKMRRRKIIPYNPKLKQIARMLRNNIDAVLQDKNTGSKTMNPPLNPLHGRGAELLRTQCRIGITIYINLKALTILLPILLPLQKYLLPGGD